MILKIMGLSFIISQFEPIGWMIDKMKDGLFKFSLHMLTGCWKCVSFWTTLIWVQDPWLAIFVYILVKSIVADDKFNFYLMKIKTIIKNKYNEKKIYRYNRKMKRMIDEIEKINKG